MPGQSGDNGAKRYYLTSLSCLILLAYRKGTGQHSLLRQATMYSESLARLRDDMHWWFGASNHQVKILLLIDRDKNAQKIGAYKYTEVWAPKSGTLASRVGTE